MATDRLQGDEIEVERYELQAAPSWRFDADRRTFVKIFSAGVAAASAAASLRGQSPGRGASRGPSLAERLEFHANGGVSVFTSKVDVGQGSRTQIAQAAAEELRIAVDRVEVVMADTQRCPDDGGTAGSRTTPATVPVVRAAAAAAREALIDLAAANLAVDRREVLLDDGVFSDRASGRTVGLAELVADESLAQRLADAGPDREAVRTVSQWSVLGKPTPTLRGREVVTGAVEYPSDVRPSGMLYGKVLRSPSFGASLQSIDVSAAPADVTCIRDGDFVGCAAATSWKAKQAVDALAATAKWEETPSVSSGDLFNHVKETARTTGSGRGGPRSDQWGDGPAAIGAAKQTINASYTVAYIQHAPMEPRAAVAEWAGDELTVWTGTQQPSRVRRELAEAFRIDEGAVRVIVPTTGGGFGGKHTGEAAVEAARLARAAGRPVSLRWTREEEFTWAYFRPAGLIEVNAGLDAAGRLLAWDFANYNSGGSAIETPYQAPHGRTRYLPTDSPLRQGSYRALASTANTFARESAMDELAELVDADPLEFRLAHLPEGRLKDVLVAAAERFDWRAKRRGAGGARGVGLACGTEKGSFTAACVEVDVQGDEIRVVHVCQAYECGAIQNPLNLRAQVTGSIVMGLGAALREEIRFADGRVLNASFSQYLVPRMDDLPELEIVLLDRRDLTSVGAGETSIIAVAPAIANAVAQATGSRLRSMPLRPGAAPRDSRTRS